MNIIFWILVVVFLVCVWFCANGLFRVVGRFLSGIMDETKDSLNEEDEK